MNFWSHSFPEFFGKWFYFWVFFSVYDLCQRIKDDNDDNWALDDFGRPVYQVDIRGEVWNPVCLWDFFIFADFLCGFCSGTNWPELKLDYVKNTLTSPFRCSTNMMMKVYIVDQIFGMVLKYLECCKFWKILLIMYVKVWRLWGEILGFEGRSSVGIEKQFRVFLTLICGWNCFFDSE